MDRAELFARMAHDISEILTTPSRRHRLPEAVCLHHCCSYAFFFFLSQLNQLQAFLDAVPSTPSTAKKAKTVTFDTTPITSAPVRTLAFPTNSGPVSSGTAHTSGLPNV